MKKHLLFMVCTAFSIAAAQAQCPTRIEDVVGDGTRYLFTLEIGRAHV